MQLSMFEPPAQVRYGRESKSTYDAVVQLRKRGCRVSRNGPHQHAVTLPSGRSILTDSRGLVDLAKRSEVQAA